MCHTKRHKMKGGKVGLTVLLQSTYAMYLIMGYTKRTYVVAAVHDESVLLRQ